MPNWCENTLDIQTTKEVWDTYLKDLLFVEIEPGQVVGTPTEYGRFSFAALKATPDELEGLSSPSNVLTQQEYTSWLSEYYSMPADDPRKLYMGRPLTQKMYDNYIAKYGAASWYDWRLQNWGCKWDADCYNFEFAIRETFGNDLVNVRINFSTPWSPPSNWFDALTDVCMDRGIYMELRYSEEGMDFAGTYFFDDNKMWESDGEIYQVDDSTGQKVTYDERTGRWRNESGHFVAEDCVRSEVNYDTSALW